MKLKLIDGASGSKTSPSDLIKWLALCVLLINLFVILVVWLSLRYSRLQYEQRASIMVQNLAHILEKNIAGEIDKIDIVLLTVKDDFEKMTRNGSIDGQQLNAFLARQKARVPIIEDLRVADEQGLVKYGTAVAAAPRTHINDREHFIGPRDNPNAGLFMCRPVLTRIGKQWALPLSRRLSRPDGTFAGTVYANVAIENFSRIFSVIDIGRRGGISLRDDKMGIIARYPAPKDIGSIIGNKTLSPELRKPFEAGKKNATFFTPTSWDSTAKMVSYRKIADYPLYVNVGLASDDYLAEWRKETVKMSALSALFFLVTLFSSCLICRYLIQLNMTGIALRESEKFLLTIIDAEPECIQLIAADGTLLLMNQAGLAMLEADSADQIRGHCAYNLVIPEYREAFTSLIEDVFKGKSGILEFEAVGLKGKPIWFETHAVPLLNDNAEIISSLSITRDITERKKAEKMTAHLAAIVQSADDAIISKDLDGIVQTWNVGAEKIFGYTAEEIIGKHVSVLVPPSHADEITDILSRISLGEHIERFETVRMRKDGTIIPASLTFSPIKNGSGIIIGASKIARDITRRKEAEDRDNAIITLLSVFSKTISREEYCEVVVELVRRWSGCSCVGLRILDTHGDIACQIYKGFSKEFWESEDLLSIQRDSGACIGITTGKSKPQESTVMTKGGSVYSNDTFRFVEGLSGEGKVRFRSAYVRNGLLSFAIVPIGCREKTIGVLHLADEKKGTVTLKVVEFMEMTTPIVGEAISRFMLEDQLQQKYSELRRFSTHIQDAREEERRNITRELHDQLGQNLTVLGINLNTLKAEIPGNNMISYIENSLTLIDQMTESVRDLMADLRPPLLDEYGLAAALRWYVEQFTARTGIAVAVDVQNLDRKIDARIESALFRIAQEALNNIAKHSQATYVWVEIEIDIEMGYPVVRLTISDNGVGFAPIKTQEHIRNHGWGLAMMNERAEGIGSTCRVESTPGKGTVVTIEAML
ncbi:MAG: PAS domain S-box protein [Nitrospirae bacterium]|nr:PAS domain S-box protein [Nitrospirota bacterium]